MKIGKQIALLALGATLVWADEAKPKMTLRVINQANVSAAELDQAQAFARGVFEHAQLELVWLDCGPQVADLPDSHPCRRAFGPSEYSMRIVDRKPSATSGDMFGFTVIDWPSRVGVAGVYVPAVTELAAKFFTRAGDILGAAIAHEAGHLMLGVNAHSRFGIMSPRWSSEEFYRIRTTTLRFDARQSESLRREIDWRARRIGIGPAPALSASDRGGGRKG